MPKKRMYITVLNIKKTKIKIKYWKYFTVTVVSINYARYFEKSHYIFIFSILRRQENFENYPAPNKLRDIISILIMPPKNKFLFLFRFDLGPTA